MTYHIMTVSLWFMTDYYGAKIKYPDGHWSSYFDGQSGGWVLTEAGEYKIQAAVHVTYDLGGGSDYWMYSNILTFYVVDEYPPAIPGNFSASFTGQHPVLIWSGSQQSDINTFTIAKMIQGETGWADISTISSQTTQWTDNTVDKPGKFDPVYTILYKIKANDINGNASNYSTDQSVTGTTTTFWKKMVEFNEQPISEYKLYQNYPNPFNPSTYINFALPKDDFISLRVYNAIGEQVAELVDNSLEKGIYSVEFDSKNLPSGIYIYRIQSKFFNYSRKMILVR